MNRGILCLALSIPLSLLLFVLQLNQDLVFLSALGLFSFSTWVACLITRFLYEYLCNSNVEDEPYFSMVDGIAFWPSNVMCSILVLDN